MKYVDRLLAAFAELLVRRPGAVLVALLLLTGASLWGALGLRINSNQLDLISQELRAVKDVKRVVDMVGGAGHLLIALRGSDPDVLKATADDLAAALKADTENTRHVVHKIDTSFILEKAPLFVESADLEEIRRQVTAKIKDVIRRNSPFFVELKPTPPVELKLDPIIEKYKKVGKKSIADDYYISDDKQMVLLIHKPMWDSNQLDRTGKLVEKLRADFTAYTGKSDRSVRLTESYAHDPDPDGKHITFGFTGSYKTNFDDSNEMEASLVPAGTISLIGIIGVLFLFLGRRPVAVLLLTTGMILGTIITFGFARATVGELNMITSILGGILMGTGIDFGIHLTYRLRYELGLGHSIEDSVRATVRHAGAAAFVSALACSAAFFALLFSEFRGFSQFGFLAGFGTLIIGTTIFAWVPAVLLLLARRWPGAPLALIGATSKAQATTGRIVAARGIAIGAGLVALGVAWFATDVGFEYNTRALMVESQPSVMLQDEIAERFQISADPVAVYSRTVEDSKKLFDLMVPLDAQRFSTVDQVVSMWTFVPPPEQQKKNVEILQRLKADLSEITVDAIPEEHQENYKKLLKYLDTEAYGLEQVPAVFRDQFTHLPTTKPENHGYLTFVYPTVDLWDGKQMLKFGDEVEVIKAPDGTEYNSAGLPILFAKLARIVLFDGRFSVALTAVLLFVLLLVDFRSLRETLVALTPLMLGMAVMLGVMELAGWQLNFMNIVVLPVVLGFGISHGVYFMHRFNEGMSPYDALRIVGAPVAASTLTALAGWAGLLSAGHKGLKSMGTLACVGIVATLAVSFTLLPALLQILHDRRVRKGEGRI